MSKAEPLVVVTRKIPEAGLRLLEEKYHLKVSPHDRVLKPQELKKFVKGADAILCLLTDRIDEGVLAAAGENLKVVANYAVGFDNIDIAATKKRKVIVTNTPGVLTEAVAEHTFALLSAISRRIVESDKFVRAGKYKVWEPELLLGPQLEGKTLGVIGLGRIGGRVAEVAALGYRMRVFYYDRGKRNREVDKKIGSRAVTMRKLLTSSDFISLHVPLTPGTRHLIGRPELESMKKSTVLINTSRGPVIDEKALAWALENSIIWGAAIDVFEKEPEVTLKLKKLDNIVMTPHTASATHEARDAMAEIAAKNIIGVLSGKEPINPVK